LLRFIPILLLAASAAPAADSLCPLANDSHGLSMVTFFDGKPEEQASLVYDEMHTTKDGSRALWRLTPDAPRGYSLVCAYEKTSKTVTKPLSPKFSTCTVDYGKPAKPSQLPPVRSVQCK
jgi:hypothetical protein